MKCGNCGKIVEEVCSACKRCKSCGDEFCREHMKRIIIGTEFGSSKELEKKSKK